MLGAPFRIHTRRRLSIVLDPAQKSTPNRAHGPGIHIALLDLDFLRLRNGSVQLGREQGASPPVPPSELRVQSTRAPLLLERSKHGNTEAVVVAPVTRDEVAAEGRATEGS